MLFCIYANAQICSRAVARSWVSAGSIIQIVIFAQQVHVKGGDPRFNFGWTSPSFVSVRWKKIHFEMCKLVPATRWLTRLTTVAVPLYTYSVPRQVPTIGGLHQGWTPAPPRAEGTVGFPAPPHPVKMIKTAGKLRGKIKAPISTFSNRGNK